MGQPRRQQTRSSVVLPVLLSLGRQTMAAAE